MYQPERCQIRICEQVPTYDFGRPCQSTVVYHYPYERVVKKNDRNDVLLSETTAIRRELSQIKNDISKIKRQPAPTVYYTIKEEHPPAPTVYYAIKEERPTVVCSICNAAFYQPNEEKHYSNIPMYYCERCHSFVDKPDYTVKTLVRSKTPTTTYQDSYQRPLSCTYPYGRQERRITLNELQTEPAPSSGPVQHPRHWIPTASKNSYPHRRWNLSVPHSEP